MTINVVAALTVRAGRSAEFEAAVARARAQVIQNPDCHRYDLQRVRRSEVDYVMLECWESPAALREHGSSEAFAAFGAELADVVAGPPVVTVYEPVGDQVALA
ncbi:antibiotic biosynthesis monooxygenase [Nocardioides albidus]|uniref:Antibiotic biosynthesis monooxygenase n=1 Tax=Nocardioides albidus TaxID=1517589 RepID=A0A5C4VMY0_9ACTN|nr:putative quinol monooxygenase [Nocardioides albidus]TNM36529.1 antibiotic biosynthesis monooxygenase [Nocardioides albidus]